MYSKKIERYLPLALQHIDVAAIGGYEGEGEQRTPYVHKVYEGYVSSLGVSLQQIGLLPTLAIFISSKAKGTGSGGGGDKPKKPIIDILDRMLEVEQRAKADQLNLSEVNLLTYAQGIATNQDKSRQLKRDLMHAAIALKLALRTYTFKTATS